MREGRAVSVGTELSRSLRRRWWVLLLSLTFGVAAAYASASQQTREYEASASLLFRDPGLDQTFFGGSTFLPSADPDRDAATNVDLVSLPAVARRAAAEVGRGFTAEDIIGATEVEQSGASNLVSVVATDRDPRVAAALANAVAKEYIRFRRDADRAKVLDAKRALATRDGTGDAANGAADEPSLATRLEQLDILASLQTGNAELVQPASPPTKASSPRVMRATVAGGMLGLVVGLIGVSLAQRFDRTLRSPDEVAELTTLPILGSIPTLRSDTPESSTSADVEAFSMLRAQLRYFEYDRRVQTLVVTSGMPGDGKSTVTWHLAAASALAGDRVLLLEGDLRRPTLAQKRQLLIGTPGLAEVLAGFGNLEEAIQRIPLGDHGALSDAQPTLDVLVAGSIPPNPLALLESERLMQVMEAARHSYDLILIDTPPAAVVSDAISVMRCGDAVIAVTRLGHTLRETFVGLQEQLEKTRVPILGYVVNGVAEGAGYYRYGREYSSSENANRLEGISH